VDFKIWAHPRLWRGPGYPIPCAFAVRCCFVPGKDGTFFSLLSGYYLILEEKTKITGKKIIFKKYSPKLMMFHRTHVITKSGNYSAAGKIYPLGG
jgi:hypothetical protein